MKGDVKSDNVYFNNDYVRAMFIHMHRHSKDVV